MREQHQIICWEEPPAAKGGPETGEGPHGHSPWRDVAAELRRRRGEWAVISEHAESRKGRNGGELANRVNFGRLQSFRPAGDFEAVSRRRDGVVRTYVRYLGDGEDPGYRSER